MIKLVAMYVGLIFGAVIWLPEPWSLWLLKYLTASFLITIVSLASWDLEKKNYSYGQVMLVAFLWPWYLLYLGWLALMFFAKRGA